MSGKDLGDVSVLWKKVVVKTLYIVRWSMDLLDVLIQRDRVIEARASAGCAVKVSEAVRDLHEHSRRFEPIDPRTHMIRHR
jgi:hypothetical protein